MPAVRFDVVPGLVPVLLDELGHVQVLESSDGHVVVDTTYARALEVRTAYAAYARTAIDVPRPKALLGDAHLRAITDLVRRVAATQPFTALRVGAAGADSPVMRRLADELARAARLPVDPDDGDLLVRIIPSWQVLVRLTPRPLSLRPWHEPGFEGALDASVAAAMVRLTRPRPGEVFLDPMCGSGTIVLERRHTGPLRLAIGSDLSGDARADVRADATRLPLPDASVDAVATNPPWGHRFESGDDLNGALLAELGRVARPDARAAVLTHDIKRFERALRTDRGWTTEHELRLDFRGHHPRLYVLRRP